MKTAIKSLSLFACSAIAAGCADAPQEESVVIDEMGSSSLQAAGEVRFDSSAAGETMSVIGSGWTASAPGIYERGGQRLVVGAQGHLTAIAQGQAQLLELRQRGAGAAQLDASARNLELLKGAAAQLKEDGPSTQATCNIGFILGPSSPATGIVGAIAATQISCSVGVQTFTVQTQACTNFGCSAVTTGTNTVGVTPWTFGVVRTGTAGAACSAAAVVTPPGVGASWNGACG